MERPDRGGEGGTGGGAAVSPMELRVLFGGQELTVAFGEMKEEVSKLCEHLHTVEAKQVTEDRVRTLLNQGLGSLNTSLTKRFGDLNATSAAKLAAAEEQLAQDRAESRRNLGDLALKLHGLEVLGSRLETQLSQMFEEPEVRRCIETSVLTLLPTALSDCRPAWHEECAEQLAACCADRSNDVSEAAQRQAETEAAFGALRSEVGDVAARVDSSEHESQLESAISAGREQFSEMQSRLREDCSWQVEEVQEWSQQCRAELDEQSRVFDAARTAWTTELQVATASRTSDGIDQFRDLLTELDSRTERDIGEFRESLVVQESEFQERLSDNFQKVQDELNEIRQSQARVWLQFDETFGSHDDQKDDIKTLRQTLANAELKFDSVQEHQTAQTVELNELRQHQAELSELRRSGVAQHEASTAELNESLTALDVRFTQFRMTCEEETAELSRAVTESQASQSAADKAQGRVQEEFGEEQTRVQAELSELRQSSVAQHEASTAELNESVTAMDNRFAQFRMSCDEQTTRLCAAVKSQAKDLSEAFVTVTGEMTEAAAQRESRLTEEQQCMPSWAKDMANTSLVQLQELRNLAELQVSQLRHDIAEESGKAKALTSAELERLTADLLSFDARLTSTLDIAARADAAAAAEPAIRAETARQFNSRFEEFAEKRSSDDDVFREEHRSHITSSLRDHETRLLHHFEEHKSWIDELAELSTHLSEEQTIVSEFVEGQLKGLEANLSEEQRAASESFEGRLKGLEAQLESHTHDFSMNKATSTGAMF